MRAKSELRFLWCLLACTACADQDTGLTSGEVHALTTASGITREEDLRIPPGPPGKVLISQEAGRHIVSWKGTRDDTIQGYAVFKRCARQKQWLHVGTVSLGKDTRNRGVFKFEMPFENGCTFAVAALAADGKPGPKNVDI